MKPLLQVMMWGMLMCVVASCANKGKLLSPSQMVVQQEKKAKKAHAKAQKETDRKTHQQDDSLLDQAPYQADEQADATAPLVAASATGKK